MSKLAIDGGTPVRSTPFATWPVFNEQETAALASVLSSGNWGGYNPVVKQFEEQFAAFHQVPYAATASNGTVTLEAALSAAGIGQGDEVIVPSITFIATATAVLRLGAVPVFADIGADYNLDPVAVRASLSDRTRAIIVVHFAGRPADLDAIGAIATGKGLTLIEDAAHAHGAQWRDRPVGNWSDIASFSFQQSKILTAGEGGILIGHQSDLIEKARSIFNQGRVPGGAWYEHENLGTNQRLTAWQAAILISQLKRLPEQLEMRAVRAAYLDEKLRGVDFIEPVTPDSRVTRHSHYLYPIRLRLDSLSGVSRDFFIRALSAEGIPGVGSYPYPLYANNVFKKYPCRYEICVEAERFCKESFWISNEVLLAGERDLDDFVSSLAKVREHAPQAVGSLRL